MGDTPSLPIGSTAPGANQLLAKQADGTIDATEVYGMAQMALKFNEDMTFLPDEIDMLLPIGLRKNNGLKGPVVS